MIELSIMIDIVVEVQIEFSYVDYINSDNYKKKMITLEILFAGLKKVADEYNWNILYNLEVLKDHQYLS